MLGHDRPQWGSRLTFVIAAAGGAIGLGNIWKFPYITGMHGGGAFVLIYLLTIMMVGLPLLAAEIMIGKSTQASPVPAIKQISGAHSPWKWIGVLSITSAFVILSYYSVVSGWTLHYLLHAVRGNFTGKEPEEIYNLFGQLYAHGPLNVFWHFVVMLICSWIIWRGLKGGIERATQILMPILLLLLMVLLVNGMLSPGAGAGFRFMFYPDFSKLTPSSILEAVGHGFFTLSLGMGAMITYGSYLRRESDLMVPSLAVAFADTGIALMAGLAIFPIVFSYGFEPDAGPGLVFRTLPVVFSQMPGGSFLAIFFFLLLFLAALTSAISLLEVVVAYLVDSRILKRHTASLLGGTAIFLLGLLSALSGGPLAKFKVPLLERNLFDSFDYLATNWFLPLGGLVIATYVAWVVPSELTQKEFTFRAPIWWSYRVWIFLLRWVTPVGVVAVFLNKIGLF